MKTLRVNSNKQSRVQCFRCPETGDYFTLTGDKVPSSRVVKEKSRKMSKSSGNGIFVDEAVYGVREIKDGYELRNRDHQVVNHRISGCYQCPETGDYFTFRMHGKHPLFLCVVGEAIPPRLKGRLQHGGDAEYWEHPEPPEPRPAALCKDCEKPLFYEDVMKSKANHFHCPECGANTLSPGMWSDHCDCCPGHQERSNVFKARYPYPNF